jgi:hypothetical protein
VTRTAQYISFSGQLHPTKAVLWIQGAAWEFEDNGNVNSARGTVLRVIL